MKRINIFSLIVAALTISTNGWAQCGRCGNGGGGGQSQGFVSTTTYRTSKLTAMPSGNGKVSVSLISRTETLQDFSVRSSLQFVIDYSGVATPVTVTGLDVVEGLTATSPGISVVNLAPYLTGPPPVVLQNTGKMVRQGPELDFTAFASTLSGYTVRLQFDNATPLVVGTLIPVQTEFVAIAALAPETMDIGGSIPANSVGTGALTASIARDTSGAIASAEIRFDLRNQTSDSLFGGTNITKVDIHSGGAGGAVALDSLTSSFQLRSGIRSLLPRQIDSSNTVEILALEGLIKDPTSYYFDFHTDRNPGGELGGVLQHTENYIFLLHGDAADGYSGTGLADALVNVNVLRNPGGYDAGLVTFDFLYRDFNAGDVHNGLTAFDGPVPMTVESQLTFDPSINDLTVRANTTGGIVLRDPVLGNSELLASLVANTPATFGAILLTNGGGSGALYVLSQDLIPGFPRITNITPPITTPGSVITITGDSLSAAPKVYVGGALATTIGSPSSNTIVARVPTSLSVNVSSLNTPVFIADALGRASNTLTVGVDIAEPQITSLADSLTKLPIGQTNPLQAGNSIDIESTGVMADPANPNQISPLVGISVNIDGTAVAAKTTIVADPANPGYWTVTVQVPTGTPAGKHSLQLVATVTVDTTGVLTAYPFPSPSVDLYTK